MSTVETLDKLERRITISIPRDEVQAEVDKQLKIRARTARAPGFRPGKVPLKMVAAQYEPEIRANILHEKIDAAFTTTTNDNSLRVAGHPRIEHKTGDGVPETHFAFDAIFEVYPEVKVGDLSAMTLEKYSTDITDAEVDDTIMVLRKRQAHFHVRGEQGEHGDGGPDTSAQNGDMVIIDFAGTIDGNEFEGGKTEGYAFVLGEGQMLPEFEQAVLGMRAGETKTFPLTFPENYHGKDVAGKTAEFKVSVSKTEWPHLPEIDADFIKSMGVASGELSDLREEIRANLVRESDTRVKSKNKDSVMEALLAAVDFDVPNALVEREIDNLFELTRQNMAQNGQDPSSLNVPRALFNRQAERRVRLGLIVGELIDQNKLKAEPEQVRAQIESIASSYQEPQMIVNYYYGDRNRLAEVESMVLEDNIVNYVLGKAQVTEKVLPFKELMSPGATA